MNACFTLLMKRRWAWENTWLVYSFLSLVMLPAIVTLAMVLELGAVYRASGIAEIVTVPFFRNSRISELVGSLLLFEVGSQMIQLSKVRTVPDVRC